MIADDCLVCSGPLHDSWLGAAVGLFAVFYGSALFFAMLHLHIDRDAPLRGLVWRAVPVPFAWSWIVLRWLSVLFLPPERRPRLTRMELERRIEHLEHELEIGR